MSDYIETLIEQCKAKYIKVPVYILECPDLSLRTRALIILAKGHEDRDRVLTQCKKAWQSIHEERLRVANEQALKDWAEHLKYKDKL